VHELRLARIATVERANTFITERFVGRYNDEFAVPPADPASAFVTAGAADLDQILCHEGRASSPRTTPSRSKRSGSSCPSSPAARPAPG
jgi:hypothetical protein